MQNAETNFYLALPRLVARFRGRSGTRSEMNWHEANLVGGAVHCIAYFFAAEIFLRGLALWTQVFLLLPLAIAVWLAWLMVFYLNSLVIRLLRTVGLLRELPDDRAQSIVISIMITGFAFGLWRAEGWLGLIGGIWIAAVALNLAAATVLALTARNESTAA